MSGRSLAIIGMNSPHKLRAVLGDTFGGVSLSPQFETGPDILEEWHDHSHGSHDHDAVNEAASLAQNFLGSMSISALPPWLFSSGIYIAPPGTKIYIPQNIDRNILSLFSGSQWSGNSITYAFPDARSDYEWINPSADGFRRLSFETEQAIRYALEGYSPLEGGPRMSLNSVESLTNLSFSYAGRNGGTLQIAAFSPVGPITASHGYYPGIPFYGGDVWLTTGSGRVVTPGTYQNYLVLHELGHALGLKHPFEATGPLPAIDPRLDSAEYTVMTYNWYVDSPQTYMMYDIAALQEMYGADFSTNSGNTVYKWDPSTGETFVDGVSQGEPARNNIFLTIWDGGGSDTYDLSAYSAYTEVDLAPGGYSMFSPEQLARRSYVGYAAGNVYNSLLYRGDTRSLIENVLGGSGTDYIRGNIADNRLIGNAGNDSLHGGNGNDTLDGGDGDDLLDDTIPNSPEGNYVYGNDLMIGNGGNDRIFSRFGHDTLFGGIGDDYLDSGEDNDLVYGGYGNDTIAGWTGHDALYGEDGNDTIYAGDGDDFTGGGAGNDLIYADGGQDDVRGNAGDDTIRGGLDNDILWGGEDNDTLYGEAGDDDVVGESGNDWLEGNEGNDVLVAGDGDDSLLGGNGNDHLAGDAGADRFEGGNGNDTLYGGTQDDTLSGGGDADLIHGEEGADVLAGDDGNDTLHGGAGGDILNGGSGVNSLVGGAGDDFYVIRSARDTVLEDLQTAIGGTDTAFIYTSDFTSVAERDAYRSYLLANGIEIVRIDEAPVTSTTATRLILSDNSIRESSTPETVFVGQLSADVVGSFVYKIVLTDSAGRTTLVDSDGRFRINGTRLETDSSFVFDYEVQNRYDIKIRVMKEGATRSTDWFLEQSLTINVRDVWNEKAVGTHANDRLLGDVGNDLLQGGAGNDTIGGGAGRDTLVGGEGNDVFLFNQAPTLGSRDVIEDFTQWEDKIQLSASAFNLGDVRGALMLSQFTQGAAATSVSHRIIYDPSTGKVFYDSTGSMNGADDMVEIFSFAANKRPEYLFLRDFDVIA